MTLRKKRMLLLRLSLVLVVLVAVFVRPNWKDGSQIPYLMEGAGQLLLLAGLGVRVWSILYIGGRKSKELIADGPYSLCRHPLYLGSFLIALGAALCFQNLILLILGFLLIVPIHTVVARMEEAHLLEIFGDRYADYTRRVPRFLPRFSAYQSPETITVSIRAVRRASIDAMAIMLIPLCARVLGLLHERGIVPVLFHFPQ